MNQWHQLVLSRYCFHIGTFFSLILDNEIDKKYLIESNNEFESLPASEDVFQDQIQIFNTEITAKKFKQQEAEFRLKGEIVTVVFDF